MLTRSISEEYVIPASPAYRAFHIPDVPQPLASTTNELYSLKRSGASAGGSTVQPLTFESVTVSLVFYGIHTVMELSVELEACMEIQWPLYGERSVSREKSGSFDR